MFANPDAAWHVATTRYQDALTEAARNGLAARALEGSAGGRRTSCPLRRWIGAALIQVGQRLQGVRPQLEEARAIEARAAALTAGQGLA